MGLLDAGFWTLEDQHSALHIGSVTLFDGAPPVQTELIEHIGSRLDLLPRYRKRMRTVPLGIARPVWVDDPRFDLSYHIRRTALPAPGGELELQALVERLMSQRLDPERPLWEAWLVEGMGPDRWAMVWKVHHSMVDGVGGMGLLAAALDPTPEVLRRPARPWTPRPAPKRLGLVGSGVLDLARTGARASRNAATAARHPARSVRTVVGTAAGLRRYASAARPVAQSSLLGSLSAERRYTSASIDFDDVRAVRSAWGGSVNDVVLAVVTRGFRDLLLARQEHPAARTVRCLIPVSVRAEGDGTRSNNRISALLAALPVDVADPVEAYRMIVAQTAELKASHEAGAGQVLAAAAEYLPPGPLNSVLRAAFRLPQRFITTVVTNVPGPRDPLYLLGRRLIAIYPYVPLADQLRTGVAVASYNGRLYFGLTCDRDAVADGGVLARGIADGMRDLAAASTQSQGSLLA